MGRAAGDLPPRLPPEASVGSRLTRRCDPARRPRPRTRRFTSCPGPSRCLKSRQRRYGLEALPPNGSPQGFWPLLAYGAPPPEIDAECAPRSLASVLRAPQPSPPPHAPIPHPLAAQRHPHASLARLAATVLSRRCSELAFDLDQGWIHISVMHVGMWFDVLIRCQLSCGMHGRQFGRLRAPVGCLPPPRGQSAIFLETRHQCDALYMTFEMSSTTYKARVWFNSDV